MLFSIRRSGLSIFSLRDDGIDAASTTLGAVAVAATLIAPRGIRPFIREPFGIERLSNSRKLAGMAATTKTAAITPAAATNPERHDKGKYNERHDTSKYAASGRRPAAGRLRPRADLRRHDR